MKDSVQTALLGEDLSKSVHVHRRLKYWARKKKGYSRRVGVRIDPKDSQGLAGAEEIFYEKVMAWAKANGYTVDNSIRPVSLKNPDRKEILRKGREAIKKAGGANAGHADPEDFPKLGADNIPTEVVDDVDNESGLPGHKCPFIADGCTN